MEQVLIKRPGIVELTIGTWRSIGGAFLGLLPVLAVVAAALWGLDYIFPVIEQKLRVIRPASTSMFVLMVVPGAWVFALEKLALGLVAAPAALVTMRRILVDDGPHLSPAPLLRFWLWAAMVLVMSLGAFYLSGLAATPAVQLISMVLELLAIVIPLLVLLVFPAVAVGEPAPGLAARIDTGLERWDGNIWRFTLIVLFTAGPVWLLQRLPAALIQRFGAGSDAAEKFDASLAGSVVHAVLTVALVVAASAAVAWCYNFSKLPKPPRRALGT
ncbi:MAG: hypothetical protein JO256_15430 [Alphaproteobacteria bacterium]|nr:hypothetical protein [Alphaproteobacteria bacterium]